MQRFTRYAVLGDDVVIADSKVAEDYVRGLENLGVSISWSKSLISETGCAEFSKRFRIHALRKRKDLSPISVKSVMNTHHPYGLFGVLMKYPCNTLFNVLQVRWCWLSGLGILGQQREEPSN